MQLHLFPFISPLLSAGKGYLSSGSRAYPIMFNVSVLERYSRRIQDNYYKCSGRQTAFVRGTCILCEKETTPSTKWNAINKSNTSSQKFLTNIFF